MSEILEREEKSQLSLLQYFDYIFDSKLHVHCITPNSLDPPVSTIYIVVLQKMRIWKVTDSHMYYAKTDWQRTNFDQEIKPTGSSFPPKPN